MRSAKSNPIRLARKAAKLTQQAVANKVGVSKAAVSRWETGRDSPSPDSARQLMRLFPQLTFDDIYPVPEAA